MLHRSYTIINVFAFQQVLLSVIILNVVQQSMRLKMFHPAHGGHRFNFLFTVNSYPKLGKPPISAVPFRLYNNRFFFSDSGIHIANQSPNLRRHFMALAYASVNFIGYPIFAMCAH